MEDVFVHPRTSDEMIVQALADLGAALSWNLGIKPEDRSWLDQALDIAVTQPDPFVRAKLARVCSLRQLRLLSKDNHVAVRAECAANPFVIDVDVQRTLAGDSDASVVHALIDHVDPCRDVVPILVRSPHVWVRLRLAYKNLATEFLEELAVDSHPNVARAARHRLDARNASRDR